MATSVLGACVCFDSDGNTTTHNFGDHNNSCMIPITVTSDDTLLVQSFQIPAFWGQPGAPFTAEDAQNTINSLQGQVEDAEALNVSQAATPPVAWYA